MGKVAWFTEGGWNGKIPRDVLWQTRSQVYCLLDQVVDIRQFIEQEWQKRDDQELVDQYNRNREPKDHAIDVAEVERHRGLVIGEDGTVKKIL